jgi:hypothetical protein
MIANQICATTKGRDKIFTNNKISANKAPQITRAVK